MLERGFCEFLRIQRSLLFFFPRREAGEYFRSSGSGMTQPFRCGGLEFL